MKRALGLGLVNENNNRQNAQNAKSTFKISPAMRNICYIYETNVMSLISLNAMWFNTDAYIKFKIKMEKTMVFI